MLQQYTTALWLKFKRLPRKRVGEDTEQTESQTPLAKVHVCMTSWKQVVSLNTHSFCGLSISTPRCKRNKNTQPLKNKVVHYGYRRFIHDSPKLSTTLMPLEKRKTKQIVAYPYNGIHNLTIRRYKPLIQY